MLAAALALVLAAAPPAPPDPTFGAAKSAMPKLPPRPVVPPKRIELPADPRRPLLSNPQLSLDGAVLYIARTSAQPAPRDRGPQGVDVFVLPLAPHQPSSVIHLAVPNPGSDLRLWLSPNERFLAVVTQGELWVHELAKDPGADSAAPDAGVQPARRLYPPASGDAPLGTELSFAAIASDSSWLLVQSPHGWARISYANGDLAPVPLPPMDLTDGSVALSPDGVHATFVRPQKGVGFLNGASVIAENLQTNFAQVLDKENLYTEVAFLPDGLPLGMDAKGGLWVIQPGKRYPYFTPPKPFKGGSVGNYSLNLGRSKLAWTVSTGGEVKSPHAEVWVTGAPTPPKPAKSNTEPQ